MFPYTLFSQNHTKDLLFSLTNFTITKHFLLCSQTVTLPYINHYIDLNFLFFFIEPVSSTIHSSPNPLQPLPPSTYIGVTVFISFSTYHHPLSTTHDLSLFSSTFHIFSLKKSNACSSISTLPLSRLTQHNNHQPTLTLRPPWSNIQPTCNSPYHNNHT